MKYTAKQLNFIRRGYITMEISALTPIFNSRFGCNQSESAIRAATKNHGFKSGRDGRFRTGHMSWNKGTKGLTGRNITTFKKGNIPLNSKPLGHERICSKDGCFLKKIAEKNPYTGALTRYQYKHVWLWEKKHGTVPDGMIVAYRDGNNKHCILKNLMLITRAELLQLNQSGYKDMPDEIKPSLLALAKLRVKTFERCREQND